MAPLALEQIAEEISEQKPRGYYYRGVAFQQCRSKAILTSIATGFMGFSAGFFVQVGGRNFWPAVLQKFHVLPALASVFIPVVTYRHLVTECRNDHKTKYKHMTQSGTTAWYREDDTSQHT